MSHWSPSFYSLRGVFDAFKTCNGKTVHFIASEKISDLLELTFRPDTLWYWWMIRSETSMESLSNGIKWPQRPLDTIHPLNIANIHNINLIPTTPVNIFWILLISVNSFYPPLISANPHYYLFLLPALISTNSHNPHLISNILLPPLISANPTALYSFLLPPLISTNSNNPYPISNIRQPPFTPVNSC